VWSAASFEAFARGAFDLDLPAVAIGGLLLAAALFFGALLGGPPRLRVPDATLRERFRLPRPDLSWLLSSLLRAAAFGLVMLALAGPAGLVPENPAGGEGLDLVIALDASGSMRALDGILDGRRVTRLELAKRVVADFVRERRGDRIGLVVFGEHAFTQCPLTVDHRLVLETIDRIEVGLAGDATALGEALGLATRRLDVPGAPEDGQRVIVLFTDGRHNAGRLAPETGARIARSRNVRVHAVGIGSEGEVPFAQETPGQPLRFEAVDLDRDTLQTVAAITGGGFFHAERPDDLVDVLFAIDQIEAKPLATEPRYRRASLVAPVLALVLALLVLEAATAYGLLRRLP
jgi:Ca-activated chloride channel family protein